MARAVFTMSWDDGHTHDLRLADMLARYRFAATFYVPARFMSGTGCLPDGFETLSAAQLRSLDGAFEIGSHTLDHVDLSKLAWFDAIHQVTAGRQALEDSLGHAVHGFCYPGGVVSPMARRVAEATGLEFARTTESLYTGGAFDALAMPATFQFYPHVRSQLLRRYVRDGIWMKRRVAAFALLASSDYEQYLRRALDEVCRAGGVFHLWGHSWEIDAGDRWAALESFLRYADERVPAADRLTNGQVAHLYGLAPARRATPLSLGRVQG